MILHNKCKCLIQFGTTSNFTKFKIVWINGEINGLINKFNICIQQYVKCLQIYIRPIRVFTMQKYFVSQFLLKILQKQIIYKRF